MSALSDLISQIENPDLRARIQAETNKLFKQKKFGLVFEDHLPETTLLYGTPVRSGMTAAPKNDTKRLLSVLSINDGECIVADNATKQTFTIPASDLVAVAQFGEPIYPSLTPIDSIYNNTDPDAPAHALIQADNYHALQLLEYLYAEKVDCIYIDPPYNTGAKDWKYNNDYVDTTDTYRHSKWLSMMKKRLLLAKKLLNPADSVMIITIDEKEYLHLGCLLEELFPEAKMQMVSTMINPAGVSRNNQFARSNEFIFFVQFGESGPNPLELGDEWMGDIKSKKRKFSLRWNTLLRSGTNARRVDRPNLFYPIFITEDGKKIVKIGEPLDINTDRNSVTPLEYTKVVFPIRSNGEEGNWQVDPKRLAELYKLGYIHLGRFNDRGTIAIDYLKKGEISKVENGTFEVIGHSETGTIVVDDSNYTPKFVPGCQWNISSHDATLQGTKLLNAIIGNRFSFPKSLYAVHDAIRFFVADKPNALIVDFFAGSGTTLHAVNLLNAEDGGKRQCIMVTNNEVSAEEAKTLQQKGFQPGDPEWERLGIARYVTWPRTVCSIKGEDISGNPLKGEYIGSELKMADGFKANASFFRLGFLNKTAVSLGRQFKELLPLLWLKSGGKGKCPNLDDITEIPKMLILPENSFAVLCDENHFAEFEQKLINLPQIATVFIITDYENGFKRMRQSLSAPNCYQLYRDYLDNFRINVIRN